MLYRFTQMQFGLFFRPTIQDSEPYLQANYAPQKTLNPIPCSLLPIPRFTGRLGGLVVHKVETYL